MHALALVAVGLAAGRGPGEPSAELGEVLQLRGRWVGTWQEQGPAFLQVEIGGGVFVLRESGTEVLRGRWQATDEGEGRFRLRIGLGPVCLGIYKQERDRIVLCFREPGRGRPASFRVGFQQRLLTLRRSRR